MVIPALNEEENLQVCLSSLQAQTRLADEIIIVDNESDDATVKVAQDFGARVLSFPRSPQYYGNIGLVRQLGVEKATGEIIVGTDADCTFPSDHLAKIERKFQSNPDLVLLSGPVYVSNTPDLWTSFFMSTVFFYNTNFHKSYWAAWGIPAFRGTNTIFRKAAFMSTEGYKGAASHGPVEEWIVSFRLSRMGEWEWSDDIFVYTKMPEHWQVFSYALPLSVAPLATWSGLSVLTGGIL